MNIVDFIGTHVPPRIMRKAATEYGKIVLSATPYAVVRFNGTVLSLTEQNYFQFKNEEDARYIDTVSWRFIDYTTVMEGYHGN
jgi:hypothetical protein